MEVAACHPSGAQNFAVTSGFFFGNICDYLLNGIILCNSRKPQVNWRYPVLILPVVVVVLLTVVAVHLEFCLVLYRVLTKEWCGFKN